MEVVSYLDLDLVIPPPYALGFDGLIRHMDVFEGGEYLDVYLAVVRVIDEANAIDDPARIRAARRQLVALLNKKVRSGYPEIQEGCLDNRSMPQMRALLMYLNVVSNGTPKAALETVRKALSGEQAPLEKKTK